MDSSGLNIVRREGPDLWQAALDRPYGGPRDGWWDSGENAGFAHGGSRVDFEELLEVTGEEDSTGDSARERTLEELRTLLQAASEGIRDPETLVDLIFYARHPELMGAPAKSSDNALVAEWNSISKFLVNPVLEELSGTDSNQVRPTGSLSLRSASQSIGLVAGSSRAIGAETEPGDRVGEFDDVINRAASWCPGLSPTILKALLARESGFDPNVINQYGYAGIAQLGAQEARAAGLRVGIPGSGFDERLNPNKAIPAAAKLLGIKLQRLWDSGFAQYGQPEGPELWKFVLGAYNGGEGTITLAMGHANRLGLALAQRSGAGSREAVAFARTYASKWENLAAGGMNSPLGAACLRYFGGLGPAKYDEIRRYPQAILSSSRLQTLRSGRSVEP